MEIERRDERSHSAGTAFPGRFNSDSASTADVDLAYVRAGMITVWPDAMKRLAVSNPIPPGVAPVRRMVWAGLARAARGATRVARVPTSGAMTVLAALCRTSLLVGVVGV